MNNEYKLIGRGICDDCRDLVMDTVKRTKYFELPDGQRFPLEKAPAKLVGKIVEVDEIVPAGLPATEALFWVPELEARLCDTHLAMWKHERKF